MFFCSAPSRAWPARLGLLLLAVLAGLPLGAVAAEPLEMLVPAYFYPQPGGLWEKLNAAAAQVPLTAIMNVYNGPGKMPDREYTNVVSRLRAAGGKVIGYVYSSYAKRPLQDVKADIDRYARFYVIDGIFVDEMTSDNQPGHLQYFKELYQHIKTLRPNWRVIGNPGTTASEEYLTQKTVDGLIVFENYAKIYPAEKPAAWNNPAHRRNVAHLIHTAPGATAMKAHLQLAVSRNAGMIFITDAKMPNPWDRLPTYWAEEIQAIKELNAAR
jgi:hypothetical protein